MAITQPEYQKTKFFAGDHLIFAAMTKKNIEILYRGEQLPKKVTWCLTYAYGHDVETYTSSSVSFTDYLKPDLWSLRHNTSQPIELGKTGQLLDANGEWIRNEYAYPWWGMKTLTIKPHKN